MRKTSNKKHSKGDDLIDNEQKPSYNKKVKSSDNGNDLYPKKEESSDNTITDDPSNETSNDVENDKDKGIDKDNNDDITDDPSSNIIDEWLISLRTMKKMNISGVNLNSNNNTVLVTEEDGALILYSYPDDEEGEGNDNGLPNNEGSQKLKHQAQYRKGKKRLHKGELLPVKENPRLFKGPPEGPPEGPSERLGPVKENPGFEKFEEVSSDNESDGKNHKKNEKNYNLDDKAVNLGKDLHEILQFIHKLPTCPPTRFKQLIGDSLNDIILMDIPFSNHTRVPFIAKDENEIKNILHKLVDNIFNSVTGSTKSQVAKEILRRKDLRFHVEVWKSYVCLQAFCSANLKRNRGETTRSQAKKKIIEEYPNIDLGDLDLMLQISPRIYRLLQVSNSNWVLLDVFEEITPTFFKSKMKVGANFKIWLNLVRTGQMADYKKGPTMCGEGKKFMKEAKLNIVKAYFNGVDENLKDFIADDDEM
ncbi:17418_t:CDS:2 [Rhizophagus irregularis]|nr:17418_t:CDS:2 [Rhizophagus irregularis]